MSGFRIGIGNGQSVKVTQGVGDMIAGIKQGGDFTRISAYCGKDKGVHTGSRSTTLGRHGQSFGKK